MSNVRGELEAVVILEQHEDEKLTDYIKRMVKELNDLFDGDEEMFDELSEDAQKWVNSNTTNINKGGNLVDFDGKVLSDDDLFEENIEIVDSDEDEVQAKDCKEGKYYHLNIKGEDVKVKFNKLTKTRAIFNKDDGKVVRVALDTVVGEYIGPVEIVETEKPEPVKEVKRQKPTNNKPVKEEKEEVNKSDVKKPIVSIKEGEKPKATNVIRELLCRDESLTRKQIEKELSDLGLTCSATTVQTMIAETRKIIKTLRELGKLKD